MKIGLDIGSTTIKAVVLDEGGNIQFRKYKRHLSQITQTAAELLTEISDIVGDGKAELCVTGSAAMGLAEQCGIPFVQEVYATRVCVTKLLPETDTVIELGGEDAKILFLTNGNLEVRMNGSCAGGTGSFIDQMSSLLGITPDELNELAKNHTKIYTIASRCGVFAKSDIQPLVNQGAPKSDICASILAAVVNQTVAGLAQGRKIEGNIVYLGGPLTFLSSLRESFDTILGIRGTCPDNSLYFVAMGAAMLADGETVLSDIIAGIKGLVNLGDYISSPRLFNNMAEYGEFRHRHEQDSVKITEDRSYNGIAYIGIDAGSTTVKAVATAENGDILTSEYRSNGGNPIPFVREFLTNFYNNFPEAKIRSCAVTGYGEEMIKNAFSVDYGIVETIAHFTAAKKFLPNVDFIIDIGGQDIKCFKIKNGAIDNIFLNEACSSGCGSFLQTFASSLGYSIEDFAHLGLLAEKPVELGSRCTVFMNSSVKQAQKDGASVGCISAGLSRSVVKNALYKVMRITNPDELGKNIVVQGGTFLNDAVLRAFETEIGRYAVRPNIAGLMGAYGAALYAQRCADRDKKATSAVLDLRGLEGFTHTVKLTTCSGCQNHCNLTINTFGGNGNGSVRRFIGGNRCEKPTGGAISSDSSLNMYKVKNDLLNAYQPKEGSRGKIGIPMGLNMYELYPFWHTFFTRLGFEVVRSDASSRSLYLEGQTTIPSDTVCYPAKLMHGHVMSLVNKGVTDIFYPCMSYNFDESKADNHYNCPVVAYYPEVIAANMKLPQNVRLIYDYLGIHRKRDFISHMTEILGRYYDGIKKNEVTAAANAAYAEYHGYMEKICDAGDAILKTAKEKNMPIIVLAGRPYHIDGEINHGIDKLICSLGAAVLSEDSICRHTHKVEVNVLNQWTYHARLYSAAKYVAENGAEGNKINLVQLVSFGCGVDAITTDEVRSILEQSDKIYTQIKIDEITNLGTVKIRLRSLFAALEG